MAIVTKEDVFVFCGAPSDVRITQGSAIDALIDSVQAEVEARIGRSLNVFQFSQLVLNANENCLILGPRIYLRGELRDIQTVTSIKEYGDDLTPYTSPTQKGDYIVHKKSGVIERTFGTYWSNICGDITISGTSQLTNNWEIKQAIIEIVGIKSGLWKKTVMTEGGAVTTEQSISKPYAVIDKYRQLDFA